jgi:preprotein translocase subunit SecG
LNATTRSDCHRGRRLREERKERLLLAARRSAGGCSTERGGRPAPWRGAAGARYNSRVMVVYYGLAFVYVLTCLLLLMVVLLQQGKGGDMASAFGGGGSQTAFGARAGATVLTRATTVLGILFMVGAIVLGIYGRQGPSSIMRGVAGPPPAAPAPAPVQGAPAAPSTPTPSQQPPK